MPLVLSASVSDVRVYACIRAIQGPRGDTCVKTHREIGRKAAEFTGTPIGRSTVTEAVGRLLASGYLTSYDGGLRCTEAVGEGLLDAFHYLKGSRYEGLMHPAPHNESVTSGRERRPEEVGNGDTPGSGKATSEVGKGDLGGRESRPEPSIYTARAKPIFNPLRKPISEGSASPGASRAREPGADASLTHPAVAAYVEMIGVRPHRVHREQIMARVRGSPKGLDLWRSVLADWHASGYNPCNILDLIAKYERHERHKSETRTQASHRANGARERAPRGELADEAFAILQERFGR